MMVSTATAVLPVWRSPMMSSRWPRPIGTMESIAFRPVCTGCETDFLHTTPGATFSITSVILAGIGPLPSIGCPSEFTTRPRSSGPTGTSRMRLVHLTVSPSVMCSYSPRITAPTESRSRFSARPKLLFGNSSISPCITSERPWTRQMPSVTVTTVPCVRTSADSERFCILLRISSLISDGFSCCIFAPIALSRLQGRGHLFELAAHRTIDHFVAGGDAHAADQLLVHGDARLDPALQAPRDVREAVVRDEHADEVARVDRKILPAQLHEQVVELLRAEIGIGDARAHLRVRRDPRHDREPLQPRGEGARLLREPEHGFGVGAGDGGGFGHSDFPLELTEQLGVRFGVDLAAQDLLRAGDRERGDLLPERFPRAHDLLVDVGLGRGEDAIGLGPGGGLRLVEHLRVALFRRTDDLADALARLGELLVRAPARSLQVAPALLARGEAVGDRLLAPLDRTHQRRPDEFGREPDEEHEGEGLRDQGEVEVHPSAPSSGLANAKNMPIPSPMMNEASIRPSSRNTFACSAGIISGWRAAPSRKRLHMMPTPTQAPSAPSPTMSPMPMPVYAWICATSCSLSILLFLSERRLDDWISY